MRRSAEDSPKVIAFPPLLYVGTLSLGILAHAFAPVHVALEAPPTLTRADANIVHFDDVVAVQPKKAKARRAKVKPAKAKPAAPNPIDELAEAQLRAAER